MSWSKLFLTNTCTGKDCPVDFNRVLQHTRAKHPYRDEKALDEEQIKKATQSFLQSEALNDCNDDFKKELRQVTA